MSTSQNPFTQDHQNKFIEQYDQRLSSTIPTISNDIIEWLLEYVNEEQFSDVQTIRQDLCDPQYSAILANMQSEFKWDDTTINIITDILLHDVFIDHQYHQHTITASSATIPTASIYTDDEEAKVFYPNKHQSQPSANEFEEAFKEVIGRNDSNLFTPINTSNRSVLIHSFEAHDHEITPHPNSLTSVSVHESKSNVEDLPDPEALLPSTTELKRMFTVNRQRTMHVEEDVIEDECVDEEFPQHLNVALFHRSDDENLELLIDKAVLEICYGDKFADLWAKQWFVEAIYSDKLFPKAVDKIFEKIDHTNPATDACNSNVNKLGFIGSFVDKQFRRQINEYKRNIEKMDDPLENANVDTSDPRIEIEEEVKHAHVDEYLVYHYNNTYIINRKKQIGRELFKLNPTENNQYSWAVWKKYTKLKKHHIRSKGYWEVREKESEEKQFDKMWSLLQAAAGQKTKPALNSSKSIVSTIKAKCQTPHTPLFTAGASTSAVSNKDKKKFLYIPLIHLQLIFELMQYFYHWSIQSDFALKHYETTHPNVIDTPFYIRYCHNKAQQEYKACRECDKIIIDGIEYTLIWWNKVGQTKCNAFCIQIGSKEKEFFYLRFKNKYTKFRWDWYDNNKSRYERYARGEDMCVYKELEASFQGNIDDNFPRNVFCREEQLYSHKLKPNKNMFDVCILHKLKAALEKEQNKKIKRHFVLRFTFAEKSNHITNMEQLSIYRDQTTPPFPRNVRRLINNRNTIYFYFQNTDKYIEEWKKRYTLSTLQQQKYFFSFILCICAVMKYIEYEFSHQIISFPFKKSCEKQDKFTNLDDSDVQRHKRDFELWSGFFIPPEHQFQTSQIDNDSSHNTDTKHRYDKKKNVYKAWYKSLAIVEPLKKFIYQTDKKQKVLLGSDQKVCCNHIADEKDTLWLSISTQDVYCNRCAVLLQFSECIRKYVLEIENNEVVDFLWPWYRNYFYRRDVKKYHTSIAKYNLTYLFRVEDILNTEENARSEEDSNNTSCWYNLCRKNCSCCACCDTNNTHTDLLKQPSAAYASSYNMTHVRGMSKDEEDEDKKQDIDGRKQIRHLRKFAAHALLGGWDILRNLNVIRSQLQCLFGYFNEKDAEQEVDETWKKWKDIISKCNQDFKDDLDNFKARKLMELRDENQLSIKSQQQNLFSNLVDVILTHARIYDESRDTVLDLHDSHEDDGDEDSATDFSSSKSSLGPDMDQLRYYQAFKQSWKRVPSWWFIEHDKLLLQLALKFNWDRDKYKEELTHPAKKQYYQVLLTKRNTLLNEDEDDEFKAFSEYSFAHDEFDTEHTTLRSFKPASFFGDAMCESEEEEEHEYIGYREFQVWCENWRNIQHRLRYITFVVCDYLYSCMPSMVEIRIPDKGHRIEQYPCNSIVFLNGYMAHVHSLNCKNEEIDLNNIQEAHAKLDLIAAEITGKRKSKTHNALRAMHASYRLLPPAAARERGLVSSTKRSKSSEWNHVLKDVRTQKIIQSTSCKALFNSTFNNNAKNRIRDPFMKRDLDFELEQICQSFDLLEYGIELASFLIKLLKRKQLDALWKALGIVLEYMPYEYARHILESYQEDLRHGEPEQLKTVCDRIIRGSNFSVHIALFLAEYMQNNSEADLARYHQWMRYSKKYEQSAGATINTIESNHLLAVLLDIPLTYSGGTKVSLLQVALEQNRAEFLNNERINAVMAHIWQSPSGLAPDTDIKQANDSYYDIFWMLFDRPYHFYLTPMGFNATIKTLHLLYLCAIFAFITQRQYLDANILWYEWLLWSLNIGYILYECIEAYDKGIRSYLSLAGWINYWDICICVIWIILFSIRMACFSEECRLALFQIYMMLWAIQTAMISARSLVLFQTSSYFGVLLRMFMRLMEEMMKFLFVLALLLLGFIFGLYYIQGGYISSHEDSGAIEDWYEGFKYLFQLTVGAGDFSELEDIVDQVTAQLFVIVYLIVASVLMMNLLIALLTTTYESIHASAKTASSFAFAESTYDLAHRSRFMPAPICIYIFILAIVIHCVNFLPAMISPKYLNIYNCIHHYQYQGFYAWRMTVNGCLNWRKLYDGCRSCLTCAECKLSCCLYEKQSSLKRVAQGGTRDLIASNLDFELHNKQKQRKYEERCCLCCRCCVNTADADADLEYQQMNSNSYNNYNKKGDKTDEKTYRLTTRGRIWKYYVSTFSCGDHEQCGRDLKAHRFEIYHNGCYSCIPTALGAKEKVKDRSLVNGITLNEYAELYERYHQFNLDQADIVLLKHLTVDSLFCKYCYRPFDPKSLNAVLLTPFWALSEIISIYAFPWILWLLLCIIYGLLTLLEVVQNCLNEEREIEDVDDYDRQYFAREALTVNNKQNKKSKHDREQIDSSSDDDD